MQIIDDAQTPFNKALNLLKEISHIIFINTLGKINSKFYHVYKNNYIERGICAK